MHRENERWNGAYAPFNSLGHHVEMENRNREEFPTLHKKFQWVFQLQKDHRQPSTTPHI